MSSSNSEKRTVITPQGYHTGKCGYCHGIFPVATTKDDAEKTEKGDKPEGPTPREASLVDKQEVLEKLESNGNESFYVFASTLSVEDYQELMNRGWRRSGQLLYKQNRKASCCPHYTIRLEAAKFQSSREHRKVIHKWNRMVLGPDYQAQVARAAAIEATRDPELMKAKRKAKKDHQKDEFDLKKSIHASEFDAIQTPPEPKHEFHVTLEDSAFTEEKFELFKHYQIEIHKESEKKQTRDSFERFLCATPLIPKEVDGIRKYGTWHQLYRLDGKLIAMAVLDLLPECVSSVYFIYHKSLETFSMGKLSACREIALALEGGYKYYFLGYYIHKNKKMEYKANFSPAELMDPETSRFHPMECFVPPNNEYRGLNQYRYYSVDVPEENCRKCKKDEVGVEERFMLHNTHGKFESIWKRRMPGIMPLSDVQDLDVGGIDIVVNGTSAQVEQLRGFDMADIEKEHSITRYIAEMVAVLGEQVALNAVITF